MIGLNAQTGESLEAEAHLTQSIRDILTTPIGTRVMRRDYGSRIFELIDSPIGDRYAIELFIAIGEALAKWEPRFKLSRVVLNNAKPGIADFTLLGAYSENNITIGVVVQ